jgi:hypothetical protein
MTDSDRRDASLDLSAEELGALLAGVTALAEKEVAAARIGRVFEHPPSTAEIDRVIGSDQALPAEGESVEDLLAACAAVLAAGRRTTPAFFGTCSRHRRRSRWPRTCWRRRPTRT